MFCQVKKFSKCVDKKYVYKYYVKKENNMKNEHLHIRISKELKDRIKLNVKNVSKWLIELIERELHGNNL